MKHDNNADMNTHSPHDTIEVDMPANLEDLTIVQVIDILQAITRAIENKYAGQLFRYYDPSDERQCHLWEDDADFDDDEIPF